jgi:hypothetical protein
MVFVIFSRGAFDELIGLFGECPSPVWVAKDILSHNELKTFRDNGVNLTNFTIDITHSNREAVQDAVDTIRLHHPTETIWCEY